MHVPTNLKKKLCSCW